VALVGSLAGCGGDDGTPTETATEEPEPESPSPPESTTAPGTTTAPGNTTTTVTEAPTTTTMGTPTESPTATPIPGPDEYLEYVSNYDGTIADETGKSSVTVDVGTGDGFRFSPPAIRISTGTTITWEWTGQGGGHNVVAEDGTFDSGATQTSGTFEYTFENAGRHPYYCSPHRSFGMKGYVIVEE